MNKNYIAGETSCLTLTVRGRESQRLGSYLNRCLFIRWRFLLPCVIAVLLLSAIGTRAATIMVTNGNDSGPGSLRQVIVDASSGDTINFAPRVTTVNLTSGELVIDKNLTITGPRANRLIVLRRIHSPDFRIFDIISGTVSISRLTISNGSVVGGVGSDGDGGGIRSAGVVTLTDCTISANQALGTEFVGGHGGGVLNDRGTNRYQR